jgi:AcrR family transcriptional regulator
VAVTGDAAMKRAVEKGPGKEHGRAHDASEAVAPEEPSSGRGGTVSRILDAAEIVFAESGFAGASVRDIAARAGLNAASLYNYYPGKQELYEAVLDRGLLPIVELLGAEATRASDRPADLEVVDLVVDHIAARPAIARMLHYEALAGGESIARMAGRWIAPIYERAVDALRAGPAAGSWSEDELPLLIESLHNVIIGYFSMAPLMERIVGDDPLSPRRLASHKAFLKKYIERLLEPRG